MIAMPLNGRPTLCKAYRIIRSSNVHISDQSIHNERKKLGLELTWNRLKLLYQLQEYLHNHSQLPKWIQVLQKLPDMVKQLPSSTLDTSKVDTPKINEPNSTVTSKLADNRCTASPDVPNPKEEDDVPKAEKVTNPERKTPFTLPLIGDWNVKKFQFEGPAKANTISSWRNSTNAMVSTNLTARTKHLLVLIESAESVQSRLKRLEDFTSFLMQNPDAKLMAVKEGAIKRLLHVRHITKDQTTHRILRETFALLGHINPLPCKGIRILSLDGGGIRGIAVLDMLRKLEELTGKRIYELFDYICGVSTGSILVSCIGVPQGMPLAEIAAMYEEFGTKLFTQSAFWGVSNLVLGRAYYDTNMFEDILKRFVGETPMIQTNRDAKCPKIASVSTVMNQKSIMPFVFRNYALPCDRQSQHLGSCKYTLFEAVRASGAAPTVFQELCLDGMIHQDGGILMNNPCALAIHEAKLLWPNNDIQCVVSCGTGRHAPVSVAAVSSETTANVSSTSWKTLFNRLLESATDTEGVHTMLNDLLPPNVYFRFNPYLTSFIPMHENKSEKLAQLRDETNLYIRRNEEKFVDAATSLLIKRTATQKLKDFIDWKCFEYGIKNAACKKRDSIVHHPPPPSNSSQNL